MNLLNIYYLLDVELGTGKKKISKIWFLEEEAEKTTGVSSSIKKVTIYCGNSCYGTGIVLASRCNTQFLPPRSPGSKIL